MNVAHSIRRQLRPAVRRARRVMARVRARRDGLDVPSVTAGAAATIVFGRPDDPQVSIVIVSFGHRDVLIEALTALADDLAGSSVDAEVIVVDQLHPERGHATAALLDERTAGLTVLRASTNLGFAGGNHRGVELASAPTICLLNPDVIVAPGQIAELLALSDAEPDSIVAPRLVNRDGSTQERGWRVIHDGHTRPILEDDTVDADYASAACWLLRRRVWDDVGGFDTGYHPAYYEDVDFALRAASMGHPTRIVEDVPVVHEWSVNVRGGPPEVSAQRARFVSAWSDLIATRAGE